MVSAEDIVFDQKLFDERGDVVKPSGDTDPRSYIDIEWTSARYIESHDNVMFETRVRATRDPSATCSMGISVYGAPVITLRLEGEDIFTAVDLGGDETDVTGDVQYNLRTIVWTIPREDLNATSRVSIDWARAEVPVNGTVRAWDVAERTHHDMTKGSITVGTEYRIFERNQIERRLSVIYDPQMRTVFRYGPDLDADRYLSLAEVDLYVNEMENGTECSWTDMRLDFEQPVPTEYTRVEIDLEPGPVYGGPNVHIYTELLITYPEMDEVPCELRWELELDAHDVPYGHAKDNSYFKVHAPSEDRFSVWFDVDEQPLALQGFFFNNNTVFELSGSAPKDPLEHNDAAPRGLLLSQEGGGGRR